MSATDKTNLSGVFAPVVTPFENDEIQYDSLRFNLKKYSKTQLTGYLALGSNGEFRSMSDTEQGKVLEIFAEEKAGKIVMAGTGCESTHETIVKSKRAAEMGFEYVSVLTPGYFAKHTDGAKLESFYKTIADAVEVPVLIYNAPGFTGGVQVPPKTVVKLAAHPNIIGMKDSSPKGPAAFLAALDAIDDELHVLAGSANFFYPSLHLGAAGGIVSLSDALPEPCCELYRLFIEGKYDEARALHFRIARLNGAVSGTAGVAGVKAAMDITGYKGGEPRHPLIPATDDIRNGIETAMKQEGVL